MGDSSAPHGTMTDTATGTRATGDSCAAILSLATDLAPRIGDSRVGAAATSPLAEADFCWRRQPWLDALSQLLHYPGHASRQQPWGAWRNGRDSAGRAWILARGELVSTDVYCRNGIVHRQPKKGPYLRIRGFAVCACKKNTEEHAPTQKTPSEKKCSRLFVRVFVYLFPS